MGKTDLSPQRIQRRLRDIRADRAEGISDREFAKKAKISNTQVARMEGRRDQSQYKRDLGASPTVERLRRYLEVCNYSLTDFFADLEKRPIPHNAEDPVHIEIHERIRRFLDLGDDVQRRLAERLDEFEGWLQTRAPAVTKEKKRKAG